ncbi:hypothetical protein DLAC_11553 [Tieghemostelium lacteum]|uniref:Uncharacterized protein n=1 Tax=Tieghemostelium lacteum TaxID=361077 RepID=A0A152A1Q4_TIELA|nr:hypothetical protein DLAC_11553 [Tieghemostelium lacteum]|eukprot:KYR00001.1 hypothetical protein DLAC_11553 [Tieghemostelium lacteum]
MTLFKQQVPFNYNNSNIFQNFKKRNLYFLLFCLIPTPVTLQQPFCKLNTLTIYSQTTTSPSEFKQMNMKSFFFFLHTFSQLHPKSIVEK